VHVRPARPEPYRPGLPPQQRTSRSPSRRQTPRSTMELLELVDNEPTSRPFACDWSKCGKVRRLPSPATAHRVSLTPPTELQPQVRPTAPLPNPHKRAPLCVQPRGMRQELHPEERVDGPHEDTHRREAAPVPTQWLRQALLRRQHPCLLRTAPY